MRLGIVIATYYRPDGKTKMLLFRALQSIEAQRHRDYDVYVMGDDYTNLSEFQQLANLFPKFHFVNLPVAVERSKYPFGDYRLYCSGGVNAVQQGISYLLEQGIEYICHLDHDDWWEPNHLWLINEVVEEKKPMFVCTISSYDPSKNLGDHLPNISITDVVEPYIPRNQGCCSSSACIKYSDTKLRARDVFAETGRVFPADADLWMRLGKEMWMMRKDGCLIRTLTCHHDQEGSSYLIFKK